MPAADRRQAAPELLAEVADHTAEVLIKAGIPPETAYEAGWAVADRLRHTWGGTQVYFPRGVSMNAVERDTQLWRRFNGQNHEELAREFGVSVQWIYARLKAEHARRQPDMFPVDQ